MALVDLISPVLAVTESGSGGPSRIDIGTVVMTVAIAGVLIWVGYLVIASTRRRRAEETPRNLQPWLTDDELENNRLTRVLGAAVVSAAVLAIVLPVYYVNESGRQAEAAEAFAHLYIEEGERWFEKFECSTCHGPEGGGGAATFIEPRSGLTVQWAVPSINDVLFRYGEDEVRFWVEYGRPGTPMPAQGLGSGKGAMTVQEVDQVLAYLHEITLSQGEAFDKVDGAVTQALSRIEIGAATVARSIVEQQGIVDDIKDATGQLAAIADLPKRVEELLGGDTTCTSASAQLVGTSCRVSGLDTDRDGLSDAAERELTILIAPKINETLLVRKVVDNDGTLSVELVQDVGYENLYGLELDVIDPFTKTDASGHEVPDLDTVDAFRRNLDTAHLRLSVVSGRIDRFLATATEGLDFLEASAGEAAWQIDGEDIAEDMTMAWAASGGDGVIDVEQARRAVGLFNAYCARCHTAGYNAGVAYQQKPGSGAWAPALSDGRAALQFPDLADHIDFIIRGSQLGENYGTNGLGRGWMPGFGQVLSAEDIRLIALFERTL
jgi:mono/diheme cytochrome c family protein